MSKKLKNVRIQNTKIDQARMTFISFGLATLCLFQLSACGNNKNNNGRFHHEQLISPPFNDYSSARVVSQQGVTDVRATLALAESILKKPSDLDAWVDFKKINEAAINGDETAQKIKKLIQLQADESGNIVHSRKLSDLKSDEITDLALTSDEKNQVMKIADQVFQIKQNDPEKKDSKEITPQPNKIKLTLSELKEKIWTTIEGALNGLIDDVDLKAQQNQLQTQVNELNTKIEDLKCDITDKKAQVLLPTNQMGDLKSSIAISEQNLVKAEADLKVVQVELDRLIEQEKKPDEPKVPRKKLVVKTVGLNAANLSAGDLNAPTVSKNDVTKPKIEKNAEKIKLASPISDLLNQGTIDRYSGVLIHEWVSRLGQANLETEGAAVNSNIVVLNPGNVRIGEVGATGISVLNYETERSNTEEVRITNPAETLAVSSDDFLLLDSLKPFINRNNRYIILEILGLPRPMSMSRRALKGHPLAFGKFNASDIQAEQQTQADVVPASVEAVNDLAGQ
jgi:hypothetical protein